VRLVLASNNAKKLKELQSLLGGAAGLPVTLVAQGSLGIEEAEEPHGSFVENALVKARHAAQASQGPALADDSGLCVAALGGEPGVISAHYAGAVPAQAEREATRALQDRANNERLLHELADQPNRRAYFACTLVAVRHASDPEPLIAVGRWHGRILHSPQGQGGFGYDPLMFIDSQGASVAELDADTKNALSHRALAAQQMREMLRTVWWAS
jgi:XTP/dITP diphosphohydrolase